LGHISSTCFWGKFLTARLPFCRELTQSTTFWIWDISHSASNLDILGQFFKLIQIFSESSKDNTSKSAPKSFQAQILNLRHSKVSQIFDRDVACAVNYTLKHINFVHCLMNLNPCVMRVINFMQNRKLAKNIKQIESNMHACAI
jgi:hypothetical protein